MINADPKDECSQRTDDEDNRNHEEIHSSILPEWYLRSTLVLGCGNRLFGDDAFGPIVTDHILQHMNIPDDTYIMDVGTSAREIIFPMLLSDTRVERMIIIDAIDFRDKGRVPGEIFEISIEDIPYLKIDDFSMHQLPTSNMLKDLRDQRNIKVIVLACQIEHIPEFATDGLTPPVSNAVPLMAERIMNILGSPISMND